MKVWLAALGFATLLAGAAFSDDRAVRGAEQVAGLFVQSCVRFAGDAKGLRKWVAEVRLPTLPQAGQEAFLKGRPGIVYDATNADGKFVVVSGDDGSCSAIAQQADPAVLVTALGRFLQQVGIAFNSTDEHEDPEEHSLHWRSWSAAKNGRRWSILAGYASGSNGGQAMLTTTAR